MSYKQSIRKKGKCKPGEKEHKKVIRCHEKYPSISKKSILIHQNYCSHKAQNNHHFLTINISWMLYMYYCI